MNSSEEFQKEEGRRAFIEIQKKLRKIALFIILVVAVIFILKGQFEKNVKKVDINKIKSSSTYTEREAYLFVVHYGKEGWTIGNQIDGMVGTLSAQGDKCEVIEGKAEDLGNDIFIVSLVVVVNNSQRYFYSWDVNMRNKAVRPISNYAKKLYY